MNTRIAAVSLGAALALGIGTLPAPAALASPATGLQAATDTAQATVYRLRIDGLACPYCAYGIEKTFRKTGKVARIDVQITEGFVVLHMKPGKTFTRKRLKQLVADAGFTLEDVRTGISSGSSAR